jgi:acyl dehydratase
VNPIEPGVYRLTRADVVRYAGASGDFNPIHWSDRQARAIGLPGVIGHGLLTMGLALRVVTDWAGDPAAIRSYRARFARPVVVPDNDDGVEVRVVGKVVAEGESSVTVRLDVVVGGGPVLSKVMVEVARPTPPAP